MATKPVAWWIRETLFRALREDLASTSRDPASVVDSVAKQTRCVALKQLVARTDDWNRSVSAWTSAMPQTHRAEWLVQRITEAAGIVWAEQPPPTEGPITLPWLERERIVKALDRLFEKCISRWDDAPETEEYLDALQTEIERVARKHEAFAVRVLTKRFPDRGGAPSLTLRGLLEREIGPRDDGESVLRLLERHLEIEWVGRPAAPKARLYSPDETYAVGEVVDHMRFGTGKVIEVLSDHVRVQFEDRPRALLTRRCGAGDGAGPRE